MLKGTSISRIHRTIGCCALIPKSYAKLRDVRALLFDLDGTLVQPTIDFAMLNQAVHDVISGYGAAASLDRPMPALEMIATASCWLKERGDPCAEELREAGQAAILAIELAAAEAASAFAGVAALLSGLRMEGRRVAIVTRNSRTAAERILSQGRLEHDLLLSRDDVGRVKPDPEHLCVALGRLGIAATEAVMCGDHVMDVIAGRRAGMRTVGVLTGGSAQVELLQAGAELVLPCITELSRHLDGFDATTRKAAS